MRIAFQNNIFPGRAAGPVGYYFGRYLAQKGHDVHFFCKRMERPVKNVQVHFISRPTLKRFKSMDYDLKVALMTKKFDFFYNPPPLLTSALAKSKGIKTIIPVFSRSWQTILPEIKKETRALSYFPNHPHIAFTHTFYLNLMRTRYIILINYLLKVSDLIHVPCNFTKQSYTKEGYDDSKFVVVPHGVDVHLFKPSRTNHERFNILFVGADPIRKGLIYLLSAFKKIRHKYKSKLIVVGFRANIKRKDVEVVSSVPHSCMRYYYNISDVLVLPSVDDALPFSLLEAMSCGLPVIASENCGCNEVIRDGQDGFIIPVRDEKSIYNSVAYLIENEKERRRMGRKARETAERNSWTIQAKKFEKILEKMLER